MRLALQEFRFEARSDKGWREERIAMSPSVSSQVTMFYPYVYYFSSRFSSFYFSFSLFLSLSFLLHLPLIVLILSEVPNIYLHFRGRRSCKDFNHFAVVYVPRSRTRYWNTRSLKKRFSRPIQAKIYISEWYIRDGCICFLCNLSITGVVCKDAQIEKVNKKHHNFLPNIFLNNDVIFNTLLKRYK